MNFFPHDANGWLALLITVGGLAFSLHRILHKIGRVIERVDAIERQLPEYVKEQEHMKAALEATKIDIIKAVNSVREVITDGNNSLRERVIALEVENKLRKSGELK